MQCYDVLDIVLHLCRLSWSMVEREETLPYHYFETAGTQRYGGKSKDTAEEKDMAGSNNFNSKASGKSKDTEDMAGRFTASRFPTRGRRDALECPRKFKFARCEPQICDFSSSASSQFRKSQIWKMLTNLSTQTDQICDRIQKWRAHLEGRNWRDVPRQYSWCHLSFTHLLLVDGIAILP